MSTLLFALTVAHAGPAFNDWTGDLELPKNTSEIAIQSVEGDIDIRVDAEAKQPRVEVVDARPGRACKLEITKDRRGKTGIAFGPKDLEDPRECRAEFTVVVPSKMAVHIDLALGDVTVNGMDGALELDVARGNVRMSQHEGFAALRVADGDVRLNDVSGNVVADVARGRILGDKMGAVRARVGEGQIELRELTQAIEADTGVGNILVAFAAMPAGPLMLNAGNGHVVVDLPDGTRVRPQLSSMVGTTTCELPEGNDVEVVAVAGMGSVRVH